MAGAITISSTPGNATSTDSSDACYSQYLNLHTYLLNSSRYNPVLPPKTSSSLYYEILVVFMLIKFVSLTSDTRCLTMEGALDLIWIDNQLDWSSESYSCVSYMPFFAKTVWHPYVYLQGSAGPSIRYSMGDWDVVNKYNVKPEQFSNGRIYGTWQSTCDMDFSIYPFDSQVCSYKFVNFDYTLIKWTSIASKVFTLSDDATSNNEWTVNSNWTSVLNATLSMAKGNQVVSVFKISFKLTRKPLHYILNLLAPTIIIWIMTALTFMLPTDRGMKVPLTVTLMLAVYTQQKSVTTLLPSAVPTPYICQIYLIGLYASGVSLFTAVLSVLMRVLAPTLPPSVQKFMIHVVGRLCCVAKPKVAAAPTHEPDAPNCCYCQACKRDTNKFEMCKRSTASADIAGTNKHSPVLLVELNDHLRFDMLADVNNSIDRHLAQLVHMKKEKALLSQAANVNDNAWQKIEFVFNAILLLAYVSIMTAVFTLYSIKAGNNLLNNVMFS